ncbi:TPA: hypothetical protein ACGXKN_005150 [Bacillus cereus]
MDSTLKTWLKWKLYIRFSTVFKSSNFMVSINYKLRGAITLAFLLLRDLAILLCFYILIRLLVYGASIPPEIILSLFLFLQILPDFKEIQKTWRWEYYSEDREWVLANTSIPKEKIKLMYFCEQISLKVYNLVTGVLPMILILSYFCKITFTNALIICLFVTMYKFISIYTLNKVYSLINKWKFNNQTFSYLLTKYIALSILTTYIGIYIGKKFSAIVYSAPLVSDPENATAVTEWGSDLLDALKDLVTTPIKYLASSYTPWGLITKKAIDNNILMSIAVFAGFFLVYLIIHVMTKKLDMEESEEKSKNLVNIQPLEKLFSFIYRKNKSSHSLLRWKLLFRNEYVAERPFLLFGSYGSWVSFGILYGFSMEGHLPTLVFQLLLIQIGLVLPRSQVEQTMKHMRNVLNFDSDGRNSALYMLSPKGIKFLVKSKIHILRMLILPAIAIRFFLVIFTGAFSLQEVIMIVFLACLSILIYPYISILPSLISPHFEIKHAQQKGSHTDQSLTTFLVSIINIVLHELIRLLPILYRLGFIATWLVYPSIYILSLFIFGGAFIFILKLTKYNIKRINKNPKFD